MSISMWDLFSWEDLRRAIKDGLVALRRHPDHAALELYTYTDKAIYTPGAWDNPAVRHCRGLIVDVRTDEIVARPWAKFFNHNQKEAAQIGLDEPVEVYDKLDGSLGIGYLWGGKVRVATRGSFTSDQAWHAMDWLEERGGLQMFERPEMFDYLTPLFEIVYPENRIVVDYGERDELVLLGAVRIEDGHSFGADTAADLFLWQGQVAEALFKTYPTFRDALSQTPRPGMEGVVIHSLHQPQALVKIKQEDYIHLHRIVTGLNERAVWERMMAGDGLTNILDGLPDELHEWVREVYWRLADEQDAILLRAYEVHADLLGKCGSVDVSRAEYAALAKQHTDVRPYLFMLLDGKDISKAILKTLRPEGDKRPTGARKEAA